MSLKLAIYIYIFYVILMQLFIGEWQIDMFNVELFATFVD